MNNQDLNKRLNAIRGTRRRQTPNVRVLAAYANHTDCGIATLGMAAGVNFDLLLAGTQYESTFGQSPFAFARGTNFERQLQEDGHALLLALLRDHMGFDVQDARIENLRARHKHSRQGMLDRSRETDSLLRLMLRNDPEAPNLITGAVLTTRIGGIQAFFEADALAARFGGQIHTGEVKSFPIVDERADADKLGSALDQAAIYTLLNRETVERLGGNPDIVSSDAMIIAPKNVSMKPTLKRVDVSQRIVRSERLLARIPNAADLIRELPPHLTFAPIMETENRTSEQRLEAFNELADAVGTAYKPDCLKNCGNARACRARAFEAGCPSLLGAGAVRHLPNIHVLGRAADLSEGAPATLAEEPTASAIARVGRLYDAVNG